MLHDIEKGKSQRGLEFGPLHEPILLKDSHDVRYLDRMSQADLQAHYKPQGIDPESIVPVDYVWTADTELAECTKNAKFSYCVASHVIEHVPDLIGWLNQIATVLAPGGILALAVPSQPGTFDRNRPLSTAAELIEASLEQRNRPTPRQVYCHFRNNIDPEGAHTETPDFALHAAQQSALGIYVDVHCWVFTADHFASTLAELRTLGLISFDVTRSKPGPGEFFITLTKRE